MKVIQVVPTVAFGDAIGNETRALKEMFKNANFLYSDNNIYILYLLKY